MPVFSVWARLLSQIASSCDFKLSTTRNHDQLNITKGDSKFVKPLLDAIANVSIVLVKIQPENGDGAN